MISYQPFYETLYRKNLTEYALIFKFGFPAAINTTTLDTLCEILQCPVSDILEYVPPEDI